MNKRIKELALQAGFGEQWFEEHPTGCSLPKPLMLKEYTELIVWEVMTMSDELKAQYLSHRKSTMDFDEKNIYAEGEAACDTLKYKMKRHFGVE